MADTQTVTVLVMVKTGSKYETKDISGLSHFLEHLFFKGTKRRPNTLAISFELDSIGGEFNAFTSKEWTGYYAKAEACHLDLLLDIISDMLLNSKLEPAEIEKEKGVILEEMNLYQDTPSKYVDDLWEQLLYQDQPAGWPIIGRRETILKMTEKKFQAYLKTQYTAGRTAVLLAGRIKINQHCLSGKPRIADLRAVRWQVDKYFSRLIKSGGQDKLPVTEKQNQPALLLHYKKTDQTHLNLGARAYHTHHKKLPALKVLNIILGANMSSRLFINIREQQGLCYYISSDVEDYTDTGYLTVKAGVDNKRVKLAVAAILAEFKKLKQEPVLAKELQKAKDYIKGKLALNLETSSEVAFWLAAQEAVRGKIKTPAQVWSELEKVSAPEIQKVAQDIFQNNKLNLALIGPFKDREGFLKILKVK